MRAIEKQVLLQTIDANWREHLVTLDHLRSVVGFRGYAQRDPLNEYKSEAFALFESLLNRLRTRGQPHARARAGDDPEEQQAMSGRRRAGPRPGRRSRRRPARRPAVARRRARAHPRHGRRRRRPALAAGIDPADPGTWGMSGRNDPCPCGSGKKYKHCHGRV